MLSRKTEYALRALVHLAREYHRGPVLIAELADEQKIPKKFLEAILLALKHSGILQSKKGKGGGYYLGRPPRSITFGQALRVLEGPLSPVSCLSDSAYASCPECGDEGTCGIRIVMKDVREATSRIVDRTTLADVLDRVDRAEEVRRGALSYFI
ncbi:RrF2 family transcriptional regulator [Geomesophilobacter sediminis]|uniref:Rrf2 family transcriptional regulator n=1 Tax=Geomesophilobacter sediminis TaxID=2798584 RepID=A0A8J7M0B5_9BACT|nr:Rrf2 family transcriptional regulator [Geomesophilobacter sediminis]MBJ6724317.1 Rrf2 family transcriptional regulator [Geomesophilobacter sediminis]